MTTKHFIDIEKFPLNKYKAILEKAELLPGRKVLHEKLKERFDALAQHGIRSLSMLAQALKTSDKIKELSVATAIPSSYLVILKRELNRLMPKPVALADFPGIDRQLIGQLHTKGITTTLHLFEQCATPPKRSALSKELKLAAPALEELTKLSDLSRIWGVGPVFCRIFFDTGTDTVTKVAKADPQKLYDTLIEINEQKKYTKAKFTVKDVTLCVNIARDLPKTIKFD